MHVNVPVVPCAGGAGGACVGALAVACASAAGDQHQAVCQRNQHAAGALALVAAAHSAAAAAGRAGGRPAQHVAQHRAGGPPPARAALAGALGPAVTLIKHFSVCLAAVAAIRRRRYQPAGRITTQRTGQVCASGLPPALY